MNTGERARRKRSCGVKISVLFVLVLLHLVWRPRSGTWSLVYYDTTLDLSWCLGIGQWGDIESLGPVLHLLLAIESLHHGLTPWIAAYCVVELNTELSVSMYNSI